MNVAAIPRELRERRQWVCWRFEERDGKQTKPPWRPDGSAHASADDPSTWGSFEEALATAEAGKADGIGYVFATNDDFRGVDLDACRNGGGLHPDAAAIVLLLDSYTEWSPSGNGVHVLVRGRLPAMRRRKGRLEMYDQGRYFCVTAEHLRGTPTTIEERQEKLEQLYAALFPEPAPADTPTQPVDLFDREILAKAKAARNGADFEALWNGQWEGRYSSQSEADLALCGFLAFWTGGDAGRIDRLFRASGLMREKWARDDYRQRTVEKAVAEVQDTYSATSPLTSPRPRPETAKVPRSTSPLHRPSIGARGEVEVTSPRDLALDRVSWAPLNLVARAARPPEPPEIIGLFYVGSNHLISGESEALKTWLVLAAAAKELADGRGVLWVDGDDVGEGAILERLRLFGADDDAIASRFAYVLPDEPLEERDRASVREVAHARACRLAVFDGFNPLLILHGLDPDSGRDVEAFYRLIDPIRKAPTASILTDNVVKAREARGKWAIGSERKKSKAEVHLGLVALTPLVRGGSGRARIDVHKDRPGHLERPSPGFFVVESDRERCSWRIQPDESRGAGGEFRPTRFMAKVSRYLELHGDLQSRNQIESARLGKTDYVRVAVDRLVAEGYATEFEGPRGARLVRLGRAFREDEGDEL